jgi:uncharacterized repeat protein (TIGR02543 family)
MKKSVYAAAAVLLLLAAGCDTMTGPESGQRAARDGKAAVSLAIAGTGARTVLPANATPENVKAWKLRGTKNGETPQDDLLLESADPANETLYLETGNWNFTLEGYNDESGATLILRGALEGQTITLDESNTLEFTVAPVMAGTGNVKITIKLPEGHGINRVEVFENGKKLELESPLMPDENSIVFEQFNHAAGDYYYSFQLCNLIPASPMPPELYGVVSELVSVRQNLTSEKECNLEEERLNRSYRIIYEMDNGSFADEDTSYYSYRHTDADFVLPEPTRDGYDFVAWHNNEALEEGLVTKIEQSETGDKVFWAEWTLLTYTINYELDEKGTNHGENPASYNVESPTITLKNPTPNRGYTFLYWYVDGAPDIAVPTIPEGSTGEKTFYAKWHQNGQPLTSAADIGAYIVNAADEDNSADNPVILPAVTINLADGGWAVLLTAISGAGKYVALDLSACDMGADVTEFDPGTADTGEKFIASLVLPEAATSVKASSYIGTFRYFTALTSVTGKEVVTIGQYAFYNCTNLTEVNLPNITSIGNQYVFANCKALTTIDLSKVTSIDGFAAFEGCSDLETVTSPATSIGDYVFSYCTALKAVDLPNAITIGNSAFGNCDALTKISLPSATSIDYNVFRNSGTKAPKALAVTLGKAAPTLKTRMFYDVTSTKEVTVIVPKGNTGYGTLPVTFSGDENTTGGPHWGEGFRGKGWTGSGYDYGAVNTYITLTIKEEEGP